LRDAGNDGDFSASHDADEQQLHHSANHPPTGTYLIYGRESTKIFLFFIFLLQIAMELH
jgi:hypothetical protein